jgi:hypothetical protein
LDASRGKLAVQADWPAEDGAALAAELAGLQMSSSIRAYDVVVKSAGRADLDLVLLDAWGQSIATCRAAASRDGPTLAISVCEPAPAWLEPPVELVRVPEDANEMVEPFREAMNQLTLLKLALGGFSEPLSPER